MPPDERRAFSLPCRSGCGPRQYAVMSMPDAGHNPPSTKPVACIRELGTSRMTSYCAGTLSRPDADRTRNHPDSLRKTDER
ncbi:hypothetical protein Dvul_2944 [Nitratidesulfovibrio vulgaris DP4]|uniref:Uncharacterized protein n=1 Tax=Nitratidesulfovibrio vulgaris (strain DP4) TaxID=391774 RepID=A0A0H3ABD0_NITV4|nr:hypothetical protein Dvul_2944 [Nitratidesulfovibrio vulgaris DP4]